MNYDVLIKTMLGRFPSLESVYKSEEEEYGLYAVFGFCFMPYIIDKLNSYKENEGFLKDIFDFFEEMANSSDEKVKELLMYSILETLGDDKNILLISRNFMGPETTRLDFAVQDFLGR